VLQSDIGQYRNTGIDGIGRIKAPAEPGFDDRDIDPGDGKFTQRSRGQQLELCHPIAGL